VKACARSSRGGRRHSTELKSEDPIRLNVRIKLFVALVAIAWASAVHACQCLGGIEVGFQEAQHVVHARVTGARKLPLSFSAVVTPIEVLKGTPPTNPLIVTGEPGFLCGLPYLSVGRDYVFFIDESAVPDGNTQYVANCRSFVIDGEQTRADLVMLQSLAGPPAPSSPNAMQCDRLVQLELILKSLRTDYTDGHPDVVQTQRLYEAVRDTLAAEHPDQPIERLCASVSRG